MKNVELDLAINRFINSVNEMELPLHGLMLIKDGNVLCEKYFRAHNAGTLHRMYSVAKSFAGLAVGCLCDDGLVSIDDKICSFFPEMLPAGGAHPYLESLSIRQMLSMSTCYSKPTYRWDPDWLKSFFVAEPDHLPGSFFSYDTSAAFVLGALAEKLTGKKILDYLREKFLDEIGFSKEAYMIPAANGVSDCGSGLMCTLRDLALTADFCLGLGYHKGKSLLSAEFLREAGSFITPTAFQDFSEERHGYGYLFWQTRHSGFCMYGLGGQLAACFPKLGLVFATTADVKEDAAGVQLLWRAFYDKLYPYFDSSVTEKAYGDAVRGVGPENSRETDIIANKRRFYCRENDPLRFFSLDINAGTFVFADESGEHTLRFGSGEWIEQPFPVIGTRCTVSGAWVGQKNFLIKIYFMGEEPARLMFELAFLNDATASLRTKTSFSLFSEKFSGKYFIGSSAGK